MYSIPKFKRAIYNFKNTINDYIRKLNHYIYLEYLIAAIAVILFCIILYCLPLLGVYYISDNIHLFLPHHISIQASDIRAISTTGQTLVSGLLNLFK